VQQHSTVFLDHMVPELDAHGIRLVTWGELDDSDQLRLSNYFSDPGVPGAHPRSRWTVAPPFPYISGLSVNLAVTVYDPVTATRHFRSCQGAQQTCPG